MDFIVSKVAMAICALLVVAVLAGVFSQGALLGTGSSLERILDEFCDLTERVALGEGVSSLVWETPTLPEGEDVTFSIHRGIVLVESNQGSAAGSPAYGVHIWRPDGRTLNESTVEALDECSGSLIFQSGQKIRIAAEALIYEQEPRTFVFAYLA